METQTQTYNQVQQGNGLAVTALVLGIVGLVLGWVPVLPYPLGILAIIFGFIGMRKPIKKGLAITGLITGIITILGKILFWSLFAATLGL
ncbi:DUF4190 domain-containing protein [Bacillaceae bacterium CLA-AA-H227]|uniref:DUF4190 domain-containing protein n=1 Tax=Robertmurraya yapensis (ex Hitch et al 2024) TaxID=3133160 RepID=A0ACC6SCV5_9BACI